MRHHGDLLTPYVCALSLIPSVTSAEWLTNGTPICTEVGNQNVPFMTSDGNGGFVIAWQDERNGELDLYSQKIDVNGVSQWNSEGIPLCLAVGIQNSPSLVADGSGGTILAWMDFRGSVADVYAQRLDADGNALWTTDGVAVCTAPGLQDMSFRGAIAPDGSGGAVVVWADYRNLTARIYAQKIDAQGVPLWTLNGVEVSPSTGGPQVDAVALTDGAGGARIVWSDRRANLNYDIYAQHLNDLGQPQWAVSIPVCAVPGAQSLPVMTTDGVGGFITAWQDFRATNYDIFAQRVNGGTRLWYSSGVPVCADPNDQTELVISADGFGGALFVWQDERPVFDGSYDIYANKVNASGVAQWPGSGVPVCTNSMRQEEPKIVPDGFGGGFIAWFDQRDGVDWDVYTQHLGVLGVPFWTLDGVPTSAPDGDQIVTALVPDGDYGAIAAWYDSRDGNNDIYALRISEVTNAVAISSFEATARDGAVVLRSTFRSDIGVEAVNVYRGAGNHPLTAIARIDASVGDTFTYEDAHVTPGATYRYQIGVEDADGEFFSMIETVTVRAIVMQLEQNRPNPFNPSTTIHFVLPARQRAKIEIFDARGTRLRTVLDEIRGHGGHDVEWDGRDDFGVPASSGVYFYRLTAGKQTDSKKMILLK